MALAGPLSAAGSQSLRAGPNTMHGPVPIQPNGTSTTGTSTAPTAISLAEMLSGPNLATDAAGGLYAQMGLLGMDMGQQKGFLSALNGIDISRLGLSQQSNMLDKLGLGLSREDIAAQLGFLDRKQGLADQLLGNTQAGFDIDRAVAKAQNAITQRDINNEAAAGGAWFSPETRLDRADSEAALAQRLSQIGLESKAAKMGREGQQVDFDAARYGLESDQKGLGLDEQRLDLAAKGLGLDRQQLDVQLNQALYQLGLGTAGDGLELLAALNQAGGEQGALAQQILDAALMLVMSGAAPGGDGDPNTATMFGPIPG